MQPAVAVTEFLYAHEYAEQSVRWYTLMLSAFATFCGEQGITDVAEVSAPLVRRFFDTVRARTDPRTGEPISSQLCMAMPAPCAPCSTGAAGRGCSMSGCRSASPCPNASRKSSRH